MATRHILINCGAGAGLLALAGCGAGSSIVADAGDAVPPPPPPTREIAYADEKGTASQALSAGTTLKADNLTARSTNVTFANTTTELTRDTFDLARNDQGGVDVTINGKAYSFTSADRNGDGFQTGDNAASAFVASRTFGLDNDFAPNAPSHTQLWQYTIFDGATTQQGFAAIGTEARPSALEGKASATYDGYLLGITRGKTNTNDRTFVDAGSFYARGQIGDRSRVRMNADFSAATISGDVTGIIVRDRNSDGSAGAPRELPGRVVMETAQIVGNGYEGRLTPADGMMDLGANATYSGRFFGAAGQETAGVASYEGIDENFVGAYRAVEINP